MKLEYVLFDFDGVMADTETGTFQYTKAVFKKYGVFLDDSVHDKYIGTDGTALIKYYIEKNGLSVTLEKFLEEKRALGNFYEDSSNLAPMPGAIEFITWLRQHNISTGLVSSTSSRLILAALNRMCMTSFFDVIVCGDMVQHKKPNPECYLKAMVQLQAKPETTVIFEDSPIGIVAAQKTGSHVVGYKGSKVHQDTREADTEVTDFYQCFQLPYFNFLK